MGDRTFCHKRRSHFFESLPKHRRDARATVDIDHNYCGTGILPVQYLPKHRRDARATIDIDHNYCGTGILPVQY